MSTTKSSEKILLIVNINIRASQATDITKLTIFRDGTNLAGTTFLKYLEPQFAGESQPAVLTFLDAPGSVGSFVYSVQAMGGGVLSYRSLPRQLAVILINDYYSSSAASSSTTSSSNLALTTSVTTLTGTDRVILFANMDLYNSADNGGYTEFHFLRNSGELSIADALQFSRGISASAAYLDGSGIVGTVSYSAQVAVNTPNYQIFGYLNQVFEFSHCMICISLLF
jgi:hypothetical protein